MIETPRYGTTTSVIWLMRQGQEVLVHWPLLPVDGDGSP